MGVASKYSRCTKLHISRSAQHTIQRAHGTATERCQIWNVLTRCQPELQIFEFSQFCEGEKQVVNCGHGLAVIEIELQVLEFVQRLNWSAQSDTICKNTRGESRIVYRVSSDLQQAKGKDYATNFVAQWQKEKRRENQKERESKGERKNSARMPTQMRALVVQLRRSTNESVRSMGQTITVRIFAIIKVEH